MAKMKLTATQHEYLLQLIAEGLTTTELNDMGKQHEHPFSVSPQLHYYYRKQYEVKLTELRNERDTLALTTGLAIRANRVAALQKLALKLEEDLYQRQLIWTQEVKGIGSGENYERIDFEEFNQAEIEQLRKLYDDIALEVGGRVRRTDVTSLNKPIKGYVGISPDDWDEPEAPTKPRTKRRSNAHSARVP